MWNLGKLQVFPAGSWPGARFVRRREGPGKDELKKVVVLCGLPFWTLARSLHRECPLPINGVQNRSEWMLNMPEALHYFRSLDWEHLAKELRMFRRENLLGGLP
jgi:hypothetical protein